MSGNTNEEIQKRPDAELRRRTSFWTALEAEVWLILFTGCVSHGLIHILFEAIHSPPFRVLHNQHLCKIHSVSDRDVPDESFIL